MVHHGRWWREVSRGFFVSFILVYVIWSGLSLITLWLNSSEGIGAYGEYSDIAAQILIQNWQMKILGALLIGFIIHFIIKKGVTID